MKSRLFRGLAVCLALLGVVVNRADSVRALTNGGVITALNTPVTDNFDTLPSSGSPAWLNNSTIVGWYHARSGSGTTIVADAGSGVACALYSYGLTNNSDRALGSLGSGNAAAGNFYWGARF